MAHATTETSHERTSLARRRRQPPAPLRTYSETGVVPEAPEGHFSPGHARRKSTHTASVAWHIDAPAGRRGFAQERRHQPRGVLQSPESIPEDVQLSVPSVDGVLSPPITPVKGSGRSNLRANEPVPEVITFDFSRIDYELERAKVIGRGLWSTVYLGDGKLRAPENSASQLPSPPLSPQRTTLTPPSSVFAVKAPARRDAKEVFRQEAKVLSHLTKRSGATQYIIPFYGLDERNSALVFEAVIGGSLEDLNGRLAHMTEIARHVELIALFPGLADDLVSGLEFIHANGVVHADVKPGNILLDISEHYSLPRPVVRARYIDFSASFRVESDDSTANAGGTWDFMAPEQLRIQRELNTPTFASDIWSLGITLLSLIVGGSPYTAACGGNMFMLREAIKSGDPLSFARMDPKPQKRLAACQDFVDCCRLALQKDRQRRTTAAAWKGWLMDQQLDED